MNSGFSPKGTGVSTEYSGMALVQKTKVLDSAVVNSRLMTVGVNLSNEFLDSLRARNDSVWSSKKSWLLCFYLGQGDDRLWVPKKTKTGPHAEIRVINFAHPEGRKATLVLMLSYVICGLAVVLLGAMALGIRWW